MEGSESRHPVTPDTPAFFVIGGPPGAPQRPPHFLTRPHPLCQSDFGGTRAENWARVEKPSVFGFSPFWVSFPYLSLPWPPSGARQGPGKRLAGRGACLLDTPIDMPLRAWRPHDEKGVHTVDSLDVDEKGVTANDTLGGTQQMIVQHVPDEWIGGHIRCDPWQIALTHAARADCNFEPGTRPAFSGRRPR